MADGQVALRNVTLDDKYDLSKDHVFITGTQAVIRMLLMQRERDRLAGLSTAGFVSGYRGSPIGGLDQNLWRARKWLEASNIVFQPGLNEELAATAVWGSQQAEIRGDGKYDGVFGLWYGKGPGVDRSGDVFRHANMAGSSQARRRAGADGRRPHGGILHRRASIRIPLRRRDDPDPESGGRSGDPRLRPLRLCHEPLLRHLGRLQMREGQHRIDRLRRCVPRPGEDRHPRRLHHAAGRAQHPQPRRRARSGGAASGFQARRHAGVCARQQPQPHRSLRRPQPEDRHHHRRQILSRRAPGPRRARPRRGQGERHGASPLQGRLPVAALAARARRFRARPRQGHRGRGEALPHRGAAARGALRHRQPAALHRQEGRGGPLALPREGRARSQRHRHRHRRAAARLSQQRRPARPRGAASPCAGGARRHQRRGDPHAAFLLRLPAQFLDQGAGGHARLCGHRLPLHGAVDGPLHRRLHADGRRGRELDRRGAVLEARPRVPESRRRHLQPFRRSGPALVDPHQDQRHLQDPVQRRGRHDRRAAA